MPTAVYFLHSPSLTNYFHGASFFLRTSENSHSASQKILHLLRNPKVHYRVHKSPPFVPIQAQIYSLHTFPPYFLTIHFNITFLSMLGSSEWSFPSGFLTKIFHFSSPPCMQHAPTVPISLSCSP